MTAEVKVVVEVLVVVVMEKVMLVVVVVVIVVVVFTPPTTSTKIKNKNTKHKFFLIINVTLETFITTNTIQPKL
jgi:hypothetical protein